MGFLDKHNPRATPESARLWAIGGGIIGGLVGLGGWLLARMPLPAVFFTVPFMAVTCAVAGWAMEWQLNDGSDDDEASTDRSNQQ